MLINTLTQYILKTSTIKIVYRKPIPNFNKFYTRQPQLRLDGILHCFKKYGTLRVFIIASTIFLHNEFFL